MSSSYDLDDLRYLSDEDINLLYEIIKLAQDSSDTGTQALFNAHETILPQHGIDPLRDPILRTFLLRMREDPKTKNASFRGQFTNLLRKLGIRAEFDEEDADTHASDSGSALGHNQESATRQAAVEVKPKRTRRASFDEIVNNIQGYTGLDSLSQPHLGGRPKSQNAINRPEDYSSKRNERSATPINENDAVFRGWVTARPAMRSQNLDSPARPRKSHVQIREDPSIYEFDDSIASDEVSEATDEDDSRDFQQPEPLADLTYLAELNQKAKSFRYRQKAARAHQIFHICHAKSQKLQSNRHSVLQRAATFDQRALKKQVMQQWYASLLSREREQETNDFFSALETRARKARDLFLVTKAFTHWAQSASDEILRTSAARRHILRTRYFNAWRDITAVNELKVRRQGLSKFFKMWKQRNARVASLDDTASEFRATHLATNSYRQWFWEFCDRGAPTWYHNRLQTRLVDRWSRQSRSLTLRNRWSERYAELQLLRRTFILWRTRTDQSKRDQAQAMDFRGTWLRIQAIEGLRRGLFFADPVGRMTQNRESKLLHSTLYTWLTQARSIVVARKTNDLRLMRNAWTSWNDRLRCQALSHTVEDRIVGQTLYRWVVAERLVLIQRVSKEKLKSKIFVQWKQRTRSLCSGLGRSEHWVRSARDNIAKSHAIQKWRSLAESLAQGDLRATEFNRQKSLANKYQLWNARHVRIKELLDWSDGVRHLVFAAPALQRWHGKLELTKKQQRREAFAVVRTRQREQLLRKMLAKLVTVSSVIRDNSLKATSHDQRQLLSKLVGAWNAKVQAFFDHTARSQEFQTQQVLWHHWTLIMERRQRLELAQTQADEFFMERVELPAAEMSLRKLSWRLFQIRRQQETAETLKKRNEEKHHRFMLRHWSDLAQQRRARPTAPGLPSQPILLNASQPPMANHEGSVNHVENDDLEPMSMATPGYLRTPSRRTTGRLKTKIPAIPVTPGPSHITPFMKRIRAQSPSSLPQLTRGKSGRHREVKSIVDGIPETSPIRDGTVTLNA